MRGLRVEEARELGVREVVEGRGALEEPEVREAREGAEEVGVAEVRLRAEVLRGEVRVDAEEPVERHGRGPVDLGRTRVRHAHLQRLLSRPFSTRFG